MPSVALVNLTGNIYTDSVLSGIKWGVTSFTYSFPTDASFYGANYGSGEATNGFQAFTATQQTAVRSALSMFASVSNVTFTEIAETTTQHADLRFAESNMPSTAWAYYPTSAAVGGDAWFNSSSHWYDSPAKSNYAWLTIIHETGHAMGLKHPHEANGGFGAMPADRDSLEYSLMSYRSYVGASLGGYTNGFSSYPQTLMMYDIAALQTMYGANYATNSDNTTYRWDAGTGLQTVNGVGQGAPAGNKVFQTIWDGGGIDTYDFSNYATTLAVDLRPGAWTTMSAAQLAALGGGHVAAGNIANALLFNNNTASLIENAVGGAGDDAITGNIADNRLTGGAGNDRLDGDTGIDVAVFTGLSASYQMVQNVNGTWTVTDLRGGSPDGTDTLCNIEQAQFSDLLLTLGAQPPSVPAPVIVSFSNDSNVAGDRITNDNTLTLTGTALANSTVAIYDGATQLGATTADASGNWTYAAGVLNNGAHAFTATATAAGVTSAASAALTVTIDTAAPVAPTIASFSTDTGAVGDGITSDATLTLTGTAEANSTVSVYDGATLLGAAAANGAGAWSFTTGALANGGHSFTARATDAAGNLGAASAALAVTIDPNADVNHAPTGASLSGGFVAENASTGASVGTIAGIDPDVGDVLTYSLLDNASGRFAVNAATGHVTVANGALLDYESAASHSITARVTDARGASFDQTFAIQLTNVAGLTLTGTDLGYSPITKKLVPGNDALTGGGEEDTLRGLGGNDSLSGLGGDDLLDGGAGSDTMAGGAGNDTYVVDSAGDVVVESAGQGLDTVRTTLASYTLGGAVENLLGLAGGGQTLTGNGLANAITGGGGNDTLAGGGGNDSLAGGAGVDRAVYSGNRSDYEINYNPETGVMTLTDQRSGSPDGVDTTVGVELFQFANGAFTVQDLLNAAPTDATLAGGTVAENAVNGMAVGTVAGVDPDAGATFTYALTDNAGGRFAVNAATGQITVADGSLLDYESAASHTVGVRVTDQGGLSFDKTFTLSLSNANEAPTNATLAGGSVTENAVNGTVVGTVAGVDPDAGAAFTYALTDNAGGRFAVNAATGQITVANGSLLDYESAASHTVGVRVTDQGGLSFDKTFTLSLSNVNEAPINATLTGGSVTENAANGTLVGTVAGIDPDAGAAFTYALTDNAGGRFAVNAATGQITVANGSLLDYESAASHTVGVRVTDQGGLSLDKAFTINVGHVNAAPVNATLSGGTVAENAVNGTVGTVAGVDPDAGATFTYALTDNAGGRFAVNAATGQITVANGSLLDYESAASHTVGVRVTDQGGLSFDKTFTLSLSNANEAPTNATLAGGSVTENAVNGTVVGTVAGVDPDAGAAFTYALTDNAGGRFAVNATTGQITVANGSLLDYESAASHTVGVRVTDQGGLSFDKTFTLSLSNVNEAPINATLTGGSVTENAVNGTIVGAVAGVDPDAGATFTFALTDNAGGRFAVNAATGQITVANGSLLDYESAASHTIGVRVIDQGGLSLDKAFTINVAEVSGVTLNGTDPGFNPYTKKMTSGTDTLTGTNGNDLLSGRGGGDFLSGLGGNDRLDGGSGQDVLNGGAGSDILLGGSGNDTFVFARGEAAGDVVMDFNALGEADRLQFSGYGTAAQGANLSRIDATHWSVNSADGLVHDVITLSNGIQLTAFDFAFV